MVGQHDGIDMLHHLRGVHWNHSYGQHTEHVATSVGCWRPAAVQHGARSHEQLRQSSVCLGGSSSSPTLPLESEGAAKFRWSALTHLGAVNCNQIAKEKNRDSQTMMRAMGDNRSLNLPAERQRTGKMMAPSVSADFASRRTERLAAPSHLQRQSSIQLGYHSLSSQDYRPHQNLRQGEATSDKSVDRGVDRITGLAARAGKSVELVVNPKLPDLRSGFAVTGGLQSMQAHAFSMNEQAKYRAAERHPRVPAGATRATHLSLGHESQNFRTDADNIGVFHTRGFDISKENVPTAGARPQVELAWTPFAPHPKVH